jgi:hypothetical protein
MVKKGVDLLLLIVGFIILITFLLAAIQPYIPYIGLAVVLVAIGFGARLYYSRKKIW